MTATTLSPIAPLPPPAGTLYVPADTTDEHLVDLWLHGRSPHTRRAYRADIAAS